MATKLERWPAGKYKGRFSSNTPGGNVRLHRVGYQVSPVLGMCRCRVRGANLSWVWPTRVSNVSPKGNEKHPNSLLASQGFGRRPLGRWRTLDLRTTFGFDIERYSLGDPARHGSTGRGSRSQPVPFAAAVPVSLQTGSNRCARLESDGRQTPYDSPARFVSLRRESIKSRIIRIDGTTVDSGKQPISGQGSNPTNLGNSRGDIRVHNR